LSYRQELDLAKGLLYRQIRFRDKDGRQFRLNERRLVHIHYPHLAALETTIIAEDFSGDFEVRSALDGTVINAGVERYRHLNNKHLKALETRALRKDLIALKVETLQSELRVAECARTHIHQDGSPVQCQREVVEKPGYIAHHCLTRIEKGKPLVIEKTVSLYTSRDFGISEYSAEAESALMRAGGFDDLLRSHLIIWRQLWRRFDSEIDFFDPKDDGTMLGTIRLYLFHLLQTASIHTQDLDAGVPARGWHGEAYRGHIFWDELFIFPTLNLRIPEITRSLLKYRCRRLDRARLNAQEAGYRGAMFPWQSGSDGREESQLLHLNPRSGRWIPDKSSRQRHVNAAIAYNIWQYYQVTDDTEFLAYHGAEVFLEIARFWASIATYDPQTDRYDIKGVMGPDEYHDGYPDCEEPGVNNNAYTNILAVWILLRARQMLDLLSEHRRLELCGIIKLEAEELELWRDISCKMRIIFHEDGVISQFEGYEQLKEFEWDRYREKYGDIRRLDRILEAEGDSTNRYKLSKQADVLMLFYLFSSEEILELLEHMGYEIEPEILRRTIQYYTERTSHGSSLSRVVHTWVTVRSQRGGSWSVFRETLQADIGEGDRSTTSEGIHLGAMAGAVDLLQRCYTGIQTRGDALWLDPCLAKEFKSLRLRVRYRDHLLVLKITHDTVQIRSVKAVPQPMTVMIRGSAYNLVGGTTREFSLLS
jgi:trehalose/maltose hydrolase-like predicted phosphorylase